MQCMQDNTWDCESNMKIGICGLGKLGLCLAAVIGNHFPVIGIDKSKFFEISLKALQSISKELGLRLFNS